MAQQIEFRKVRDFGENFNDSILYIRQNFRPLMASFFAICAVFMLAFAIFSSLYQSRIMHFADIFKGGINANYDVLQNFFGIDYLLTIISGLLAYVAMKVALVGYFRCQIDHNNQIPGIEDVWVMFKKYFIKVLLYSVLLWVLIAIFSGLVVGIISLTFVVSVFLGIVMVLMMFVLFFYVLTVLVPFDAIIMLEDAGFTEAISRCFKLTRGNFWYSFGVYFTGYLIFLISGGIIGLLSLVVTGLSPFVTTENVGSPIRIAGSVLNIFSYTFFIIYLVSSTLHYFSLVEKKEGTGLLHRIGTIGTDKKDLDKTEEQY